MSSFSDYLENKVLDHVFGATLMASPTNVYLAAYTVTPTDAGGGTEVVASGYARQPISFSAASGGAVANTAEVAFNAPTVGFGEIVAVGIFDALTGGNLLAWKTITPATINVTDTLAFPIGDVVVTLS